jgi:glycosyltransferase involved in cell wall biosynthesis
MSVWIGDCPLLFERALMSLIDQDRSAEEIVIVFDGPVHSEIRTVIKNNSKGQNIIVFELKKNGGLAKALNHGLALCSHNLIARMDADDISYPTRLKCQLDYMSSNPDVVACSGYVDEIDEYGHIHSQRKLPCRHQEIYRFAKYRSPLSHPLVMFRKDVILRLGGYPNFRKAQDFALWSVLLQNGCKLGNIDKPLLAMRTGDELMERRSLNHLREEIKVVCFQWRINWINSFELVVSVTIRMLLRLSPFFVKKYAYKLIRK